MEAALGYVGLVLFVFVLFRLVVREKRVTDTEPSGLLHAPAGEGEVVDAVKVSVRPTGLTARERRHEDVRARHETGACLYCDKRARFVIPKLVLIRPVLDPLYRYLNVVPVNRWKIEIDLGLEVARPLCEAHHAIARAHLERRIAETQVEYATFVEKQRHEMYEFVEYSLDERMLEDANAVKKGRRG